MSQNGYTTRPFPAFRQLVVDGMDLAGRMHTIHGLIEVDVTRARRRLREIREETGESLSFTGFILSCCAQAVEENKYVHAYRDWRNRLIVFEDVDVSVGVERRTESHNQVLQLNVRAANRKSVREITHEIRHTQTQALGDTPWGRYLRWYVALPGFLRRRLIRVAHRFPHLVKELNGTVMVTSVGMFGRGAGWGIPLSGHTLSVTVGGIVSEPGDEGRESLCLTVTFDHDIVDGAPAARFVQRFKELIESGSGLFDEGETGATPAPGREGVAATPGDPA